MKKIKVSRELYALVDDEDFEKVSAFKWSAYKPKRADYYARALNPNNEGPKYLLMHRFVLDINDSSIYVDHKDSNTLNNQKYNLRKCNSQQNGFNKAKSSKSKSPYKGVSKNHNKYQARIQKDGKSISLGYFSTAEDAALAYNKAAIEIFGAFAWLNKFDDEGENLKEETIVNFIGVRGLDEGFEAFVKLYTKEIIIGVFNTPTAAAIAYDNYIKENFSIFMPLNFKR